LDERLIHNGRASTPALKKPPVRGGFFFLKRWDNSDSLLTQTIPASDSFTIDHGKAEDCTGD
jgi:hypothetical protein